MMAELGILYERLPTRAVLFSGQLRLLSFSLDIVNKGPCLLGSKHNQASVLSACRPLAAPIFKNAFGRGRVFLK